VGQRQVYRTEPRPGPSRRARAFQLPCYPSGPIRSPGATTRTPQETTPHGCRRDDPA
jgi:hypothetical protein